MKINSDIPKNILDVPVNLIKHLTPKISRKTSSKVGLPPGSIIHVGEQKIEKVKITLIEYDEKKFESLEVDEKLIRLAKQYKGKVITCDYNLEKKANIENVRAVNINALANHLKVIAVPGESLHITISHPGKEPTQGVGYMDDGTMIVMENGATMVGTSVDVVVSRVIQTATGRILFAKRI